MTNTTAPIDTTAMSLDELVNCIIHRIEQGTLRVNFSVPEFRALIDCIGLKTVAEAAAGRVSMPKMLTAGV